MLTLLGKSGGVRGMFMITVKAKPAQYSLNDMMIHVNSEFAETGVSFFTGSYCGTGGKVYN